MPAEKSKQQDTFALERRDLRMNVKDFHGLMAPVFTCFMNDLNCSLELQFIDRYAQWLKAEHVSGVLVNSIAGEGPALGFKERKMQAEAWAVAIVRYDMRLLVQVGAAPLPDVLLLSQHAEEIGAHAVVCLPELFYRPMNVQQLVGYCKLVADKCSGIPFFYYHAPEFTGVDLDMAEFCEQAEKTIPNFLGLHFASQDLDMGVRCLREWRVVSLAVGRLLASAMVLGFESGSFTFMNGQPKLFWAIYMAIKQGDIEIAKSKQREAIELINSVYGNEEAVVGWVPSIKHWFNRMMISRGGAGISAGPARRFF